GTLRSEDLVRNRTLLRRACVIRMRRIGRPAVCLPTAVQDSVEAAAGVRTDRARVAAALALNDLRRDRVATATGALRVVSYVVCRAVDRLDALVGEIGGVRPQDGPGREPQRFARGRSQESVGGQPVIGLKGLQCPLRARAELSVRGNAQSLLHEAERGGDRQSLRRRPRPGSGRVVSYVVCRAVDRLDALAVSLRDALPIYGPGREPQRFARGRSQESVGGQPVIGLKGLQCPLRARAELSVRGN